VQRHDFPLSVDRRGATAAAYHSRVGQTVLVVDPEPFFCEALADALDMAAGMQVVGWTSDEGEALKLIASLSPDIVLAGIEGGPGAMTRWVRHIDGRARVVVLTRSAVGDALLEAAVAGAAGVLSHELGIQELSRLLADESHERFVVDLSSLGESLRRAAQGPSVDVVLDGMSRLTEREREVLQLLADGLNNAEIAQRLHLSAHTVRTHVGNIMRKLEVHSRSQAAWLALRAGEPGSVGVFHIRGPDLSPT
jgi:DNA-binding NarL/FixJ family response regulator